MEIKQTNEIVSEILEQEELKKFHIIDEECLCEMAMNLRQSNTGLPFVIWVSTKEAYGQNIKHEARIKVMNSYDQKAKRDMMYSIDIHPPYTVRRPHGMVIKSKDLKIIKDWIIKHNEILQDYWNDEIDVSDFIEKIKPKDF